MAVTRRIQSTITLLLRVQRRLTPQFASSDPDAVLPVSDRFIVKASDVLTVFDHVLADQSWTHLEREGVRAALLRRG